MFVLRCLIWLMIPVFLICGPPLSAKTVLVDTNILNVRAQPKGTKLGRVHRGEQFQLLEEQSGWGKVEFRNEQYGWISLAYTKGLPKVVEGDIASVCTSINSEFDRLKWKSIRCNASDWEAKQQSVKGHPLLYTVMGKGPTTALLMCSVHSDENTSYQCFRLLQLLKQQPELLKNRLVIAPLVNPDGFLKKRKTRTNANRVDLNRNLPTRQWRHSALKAWSKRYGKNKRRYPGESANSEPENQFLIQLIQQFDPDKVISIHAPMNFLDLDYLGASASKGADRQISQKAKTLALQFSQTSQYRFKDYRTFIGSLGRYGGEWKIPIYTLELPTSAPRKAEEYFMRLQESFFHAFNVILDQQKVAAL